MNMQTGTPPLQTETQPASPFLDYLEAKKQRSGKCTDVLELIRYYRGVLPADREKTLKEHLVSCQTCADQALKIAKAGVKPPPSRLPLVLSLLLIVCLGFAVGALWPSPHQAAVGLVSLEPISQVYRNQNLDQTVAHDPSQNLVLHLNTEDLENYNHYRVELLQGDPPRVVWRGGNLQRRADRSFAVNVPPGYRDGVLHLRLFGDNRLLAEYQLHLIDP